jgi:formylglycine-generating enzyme required for sulfatase activity
VSTDEPTRAVSVFCSYSHEDAELRRKLVQALGLLRRQGRIALWHDRLILPGQDWQATIDAKLDEAQIVLLLVSASFMDSDYAHGIEMTRALERHRARAAKVIPVIIRDCDWQTAPFGGLQALPTGGKAVESWARPDEALTDIAKGIRSVVEAINAARAAPAGVVGVAGAGGAESSGDAAPPPRAFQSRPKVEPIDDFWEGGKAPSWAAGWGRDQFGPRVDLRVEKASQRLRWIPAGKFWMGSPDTEKGRYPDEGPRHEETIAPGFWMFDTPCTQALWEAVMRENPSSFQGSDRPVESVSWDQCQEFLKRLNGRFEGLELKLPSEAQWEYACRAGTDGPRYREQLDAIAWYRDNSNEGTHPVGQLAPNAWGLFDTLGNVWEWCDDVWTDDYTVKRARAASALWVIRGGSWSDGARDVRAASRLHDEPSLRSSALGFRCAEFRQGVASGASLGSEAEGAEQP